MVWRWWACVVTYPCGAALAVSAPCPVRSGSMHPQRENDRGTPPTCATAGDTSPHDGWLDARCAHPAAGPGAYAYLASPSAATSAHGGVHLHATPCARVDRSSGGSIPSLSDRAGSIEEPSSLRYRKPTPPGRARSFAAPRLPLGLARRDRSVGRAREQSANLPPVPFEGGPTVLGQGIGGPRPLACERLVDANVAGFFESCHV